MTREEKEEEIVKVLNSYIQDYLEELQSDLKKCKEEAVRYYMKEKLNPPQKIIDYQFDSIGKIFEEHKINMIKEEIDILENLDMTILDDLAYIFDSYTFIFRNKEGKGSYLDLWFIDKFMSAPIFNALLYLEKLRRREIDWKNYQRNMTNFRKQLKKYLPLTENFFPLIPVVSEDEILRIFLTRMHLIYLEPQQDGIRAIISSLYQKGEKKLPKELTESIKTILEKAGYYN